MRKAICFDVGGTFIKHAVIDEEGKVYDFGKTPTPKANIRSEIVLLIQSIANKSKETHLIEGIGISSCGIVDKKNGRILVSANIPDYSGFEIVREVENATDLSVLLENDVRAACLGERWKGIAKKSDHIVMITLGTGIGSGIIANGKLVEGEQGLAGEFGHMIISINGEPCPCGMKGCYERYASTSAFISQYCHAANIAPYPNKISGETIMELVRKRDSIAVSVYEQYLEYVVTGLVNIAHSINPEIILIGGGISEQGEHFISSIRSLFKKRAMKVYQDYTRIDIPSLGNLSGLAGAGYLVLSQDVMKGM